MSVPVAVVDKVVKVVLVEVEDEVEELDNDVVREVMVCVTLVVAIVE